MADTNIDHVEALIRVVKARLKAINDALLPLRNNQSRPPEQEQEYDDLGNEKRELNAVLKSLNSLLASLIDDSSEIDKILAEIVAVRDQTKKSATAINKLPGQVAGGADKVGQAVAAVPKALAGIETALEKIEKKLKP